MGRCGDLARLARFAFVCAGLWGGTGPASAGMTVTHDIRYYRVSGTTTESLARAMRDNPVEGDHGGAIANVRPSYGLSVVTRNQGKVCRVADINLSIRFLTTLPKADEARMAARTRAFWRSLVAFAKRHEATHQAIYTDCARSFVARARRLSSPYGCGAVDADARRLFEAAKKSCETRQLAFDGREAPRLRRLALFATTRR
jgi:predicted secreted Zn-dependent protease